MATQASALRNLATFFLAAFYLLICMVIGPVAAQAQTTMTLGDRGFIKTAQVQCNKVRYKIYFNAEINPSTPTPITISDVWPVGTLQGTIVSATGLTKKVTSSAAPIVETAILSVSASGWSAIFPGNTPLPAGGIAYGAYVIEVEAPIDPTKFLAGQLVIKNQAKAKIYLRNFASNDAVALDMDNPSLVPQPTVVTIDEAQYKKCTNQTGDNNSNGGNGGSSGSGSAACFSTDPKIECGKVPGTFVMTLNATGGSSMPNEVEIGVLTPGVTIQNPQSTYLVNSSGQVQLTLVGAAPGSTVELDISGSKLDPKSADGMSICCAGKIKITIPKDLDCVKKVIDVAILKEGKTSPAPTANGYVFNLTATNEGAAYTPAAGSLTITDTVPAGMTFTGVTASAGWSCLPIPPITQGNTLTCTYTGGALPAGPGANIGGVQITATANGQGPYPPFKNCAVIGQASTGVIGETTLANNKSCVVVKKDDVKSTVSIEKKCGPVTYSKYAQGPAIDALGFHANCTITVTTTGPQSGPMTVGDSMVGGTAHWMTSTSTPAWACSGVSCNINGGALNQSSSVSTFNVVVGFANATDVEKAQNCARVTGASKESCVPFEPVKGKLTVVKEAFVNGTHYTTQTFPTKVICNGNVVTTSIQDGAAPYVQTGLPIGTSCKVEEGNGIAAPAGFCKPGTVATWNASYSPAQTVVINGTNQVVTVKNELMCNPPPPVGTVDVTKVCGPLEPIDGPIKGALGSKCQITVTTLGPQTGTITVSDSLTGAGTLGNATAPAPWTCSGAGCSVPGASLNQTSSTTVINVPVTFANAGNAAEARNCPVIKGQEIDKKDCVTFEAKTANLMVRKEAFYNGNHVTNATFPIKVTCGGTVTNGTIQDGAAPYVQANLPIGTSCTVEEILIPGNKFCPPGQKGKWTVTYQPAPTSSAPGTTVTIPAGGATVTVINKLECKGPGEPGKYTVIKEAFYKGKHVTGLTFPIAVTCGGTTTNATISDGTPYVQTGLPVGANCSVVENTTNLPAPGGPAGGCDKGQVGSWTTTYSPTSPVAASVAGGVTTITNRYDCKPIDSGIYVKKVVVNNSPGSLAGLVYEIGDQCTGSTQNPGFAYFTDGMNTLFHNYEPGMTCTFYENAMPQTNACGKGMKPVWRTTYAPSQTVTLSPNGTQVTVTNTLNCEKEVVKNLTTFSVRKDATYNGEQITNYNFPMTVTCGNGLAESIVLTGGQGKTYENLPDGTTCKVVEGKFGNTGLCPKGTTESWSTTYNPANGSNTTTTQASVLVTVRNSLECKPIIISTPKCDPKTTQLVGKECKCTIRGMIPVSATRCDCPDGQRVINGRCGIPPKVCPPPLVLNKKTNECYRPEPNCPPGTVWNGKRCVPVLPDCKAGFHLEGRKCVEDRKICRKPLVLNTRTNECFLPRPDCGRGERYNPKRNRCEEVRPDCQRGERYNPKRNRCEEVRPDCQRGERYNPKRNRCEEVVQKSNCPRGFVSTPVGCVNPVDALGILRGLNRGKPRGGNGGGDCKNADGFPVPCP
jgi:hypothetical protein